MKFKAWPKIEKNLTWSKKTSTNLVSDNLQGVFKNTMKNLFEQNGNQM